MGIYGNRLYLEHKSDTESNSLTDLTFVIPVPKPKPNLNLDNRLNSLFLSEIRSKDLRFISDIK